MKIGDKVICINDYKVQKISTIFSKKSNYTITNIRVGNKYLCKKSLNFNKEPKRNKNRRTR